MWFTDGLCTEYIECALELILLKQSIHCKVYTNICHRGKFRRNTMILFYKNSKYLILQNLKCFAYQYIAHQKVNETQMKM